MENKDILNYFKNKLANKKEESTNNVINEEKEMRRKLREERKAIRNNKDLVETFKDLYVLNYNTKVLISLEDREGNKKYITKNILDKQGNVAFNVEQGVIKHLNGENILGVFANEAPEYTKFICFDVDTKEKVYLDTLIHVLKNNYNVQEENLLVSYSGNKGYHVDLFFNKNEYGMFPKVGTAQLFYYRVVKDVQDELLSNEQKLTVNIDKIIEFRPTSKQGCKLPLGVHFKTGNYCNLFKTSEAVEEVTKEEVVEKLQSVVKLNIEELFKTSIFFVREIIKIRKEIEKSRILANRDKDLDVIGLIKTIKNKKDEIQKDNSLTKEQKLEKATELKDVVEMTLEDVELTEVENIEISNITTPFEEDLEGKKEYLALTPMCEKVLRRRKLISVGTRHEVMSSLIRYYKIKGTEESVYLPILESILGNSVDKMETPLEKAIEKLHNLNQVMKVKNPFFSKLESIKLTKEDIDTLVLISKNFKLTFAEKSMLILFVRVAKVSGKKVFEASYKLIQAYKEGKSNNKEIKKIITNLHNMGLITHINKDCNDKGFDKYGQFTIESNKFKLNFDITTDNGEHHILGNTDFNLAVNSIYSKSIITKVLTKYARLKLKVKGVELYNDICQGLTLETVIINNTVYSLNNEPVALKEKVEAVTSNVISLYSNDVKYNFNTQNIKSQQENHVNVINSNKLLSKYNNKMGTLLTSFSSIKKGIYKIIEKDLCQSYLNLIPKIHNSIRM